MKKEDIFSTNHFVQRKLFSGGTRGKNDFFEKNINISICISSKLDMNKKLTGNINFKNLNDDVINYIHN